VGPIPPSALFSVKDASSWDPVEIFEREFVPHVVRQFALKPKRESSLLIEADSWPDIVAEAAPAGADYLLDLHTTYRRMRGRKGFSGKHWVGYGISVAIIEQKSARLVFRAKCYSDTVDHPASPQIEALGEDQGRLYIDVSSSLAWKCMHRIADVLLPDPEAMPEVPRPLVDPLSDYARSHGAN
jgi:hypothetical protein